MDSAYQNKKAASGLKSGLFEIWLRQVDEFRSLDENRNSSNHIRSTTQTPIQPGSVPFCMHWRHGSAHPLRPSRLRLKRARGGHARIQCKCGEKFCVDEHHIGKAIKCKCGHFLRIELPQRALQNHRVSRLRCPRVAFGAVDSMGHRRLDVDRNCRDRRRVVLSHKYCTRRRLTSQIILSSKIPCFHQTWPSRFASYVTILNFSNPTRRRKESTSLPAPHKYWFTFRPFKVPHKPILVLQ